MYFYCYSAKEIENGGPKSGQRKKVKHSRPIPGRPVPSGHPNRPSPTRQPGYPPKPTGGSGKPAVHSSSNTSKPGNSSSSSALPFSNKGGSVAANPSPLNVHRASVNKSAPNPTAYGLPFR